MMKNKDMKRIFKSQIESNIPNNPPKIDFEFVKPAIEVEKQKRSIFTLYKGLSMVLGVLVIGLVVGFLLQPNTPQTPYTKLLASEEKIISYQAVSTITIFAEQMTNTQVSFNTFMEVTTPNPLIGYVRPYLKIVEQMITNKEGFNIKSGESSLEDYESFMEFETSDLLGNKTIYIMHYNLFLVDQNDEESEYYLTGILLLNNQTYQVKGIKEIEDDEETIKFKALLNDSNYVETKYVKETEEETFEMKVVKFGEVISETKFEIEYDADEIKVKLEFKEGNNEGKFEFEFVTENEIDLIHIEFETKINNVTTKGEMTVRVVVDSITGKTSYLFYVDPDDDDPYEYETDRDDDDDEDEFEDEEETEEDDD
jgi:hypothetical protein